MTISQAIRVLHLYATSNRHSETELRKAVSVLDNANPVDIHRALVDWS